MADYRLPKIAKNTVLERIQARGLDPMDFRWSDGEERGGTFSRLTHQPTGYLFEFRPRGLYADHLSVQWTPPTNDGTHWRAVYGREDQIVECDRWLAIVKAETDAPDLWAAVAAESTLFKGDVVDEEDRQFTPVERKQLVAALNEVRAYLVQVSAPNHAQQTQIDITFNYIADASNRLTKRDWKNILISSLFGLLIQLGTNKDVIHGTLQLAAKYLLPILGGLRLPAGL